MKKTMLATPPKKTMADIFLGKRDTTTRESSKADRHVSIRRTMELNPGWVPIDGIGHRVQVDQKTNEVKRIVPSRNGAAAVDAFSGVAGGSNLKGDAAVREFSKPISSLSIEFDRLSRLGMSHDPSKVYIMDVNKAQIARKYIGGQQGQQGVVVASNSEIEYDHDTHVASRAGYRMFKGGIGFVHTNGAISRPHAGSSSGLCACGANHVA
jgi:hypothetical protein